MATHSSVLAWRIPRTGAWWAGVYGVAQSRTRLKWLSSHCLKENATKTERGGRFQAMKQMGRINCLDKEEERPAEGNTKSSNSFALLWPLAAAKSLQLCPTLCDPINGSPPGSPSLGFSRQKHWSGLPFPSPMHEREKRKWSRSVVFDSSDPMDCSLSGSSVHGIF